MSKKILALCCLPLLLLANIVAFTWITSMLSKSSDLSVFFGVLGFCGLLAVNYLPVKYVYSVISDFISANSKK